MIFKSGVSIKGLQSQTLVAMRVIEIAFEKYHLPEPVITSCNDGRHMTTSKHYQGLALDLRTKNLSINEKLLVYNELRNRLRHLGFDIIQESLGQENEHIHLEWDPQ